ncbi:uncharacterized protein EV422DRAFT_524905 [Fimicolochytrium jonesii]|uniref:uncharacterized protein n=1 Tax=Fimicolochytrium jonesii TaxID=1396493 RepID=UPI0022FDE265|nr:uncharacterized protein EV422DRAFT_524905 [Fimicolochytrium jonesii]KAI8822666.1 hypothetical protein EV422DRAFT_524905 [Fimicolochytrium jonesii]
MGDPTTSFLTFDNDVNDVLSLRPFMEEVPPSSSSTDVTPLNRRRKRDAGTDENDNARKKLVKKDAASSSTAVSRSSPYYGLYSGTGFDMLQILARVASRPNPTVNLGPIDMSSSFIVTSATDPDFPIIYASQTFENLTGYKSAEIVGKNCRFLQSPDGIVQRGALRQFVDNNIVYQLKTSVDSRMECQYININYKKGGQPFVNLITIIPICNAEGNPTFFVGFQVDLMQQAGAILRTLEDNSYVIDLNNMPNVGQGNAANGQQSVSQFVGPAPVEDWRPSTTKSKSNELPSFPSDVSGLALIDDDDILDQFLAMDDNAATKDITDNLTTTYDLPSQSDILTTLLHRPDPNLEQTLAASDQQSFAKSITHYDLIQTSPDFIHILSSRGIILFSSAAATLSTLGYDPGDLLGQNISDYCHPADFMALMRDLKATGVDDLVSASYRFRKREGGYVCLEVTGHKYEMNNKKRTRCVVLCGRERRWGALTQGVLMDSLTTADTPTTTTNTSAPPSQDLWAKITKTGLIIYVTPTSYPVFGTLIAPSSLYGQNLLDLIYEGDRARVAARLFNERRTPFVNNGNGGNGGGGGVDVRCSVESAGRFMPGRVTAFEAVGGGEWMFVQVAVGGRAGSGTHVPPAMVPAALSAFDSTASSSVSSSSTTSRTSSSSGAPEAKNTDSKTATPATHYYDPNLDIFHCATSSSPGAAGLQCEINQLRLGNRRLRDELELLRKMPQLSDSTGVVA